MTEDDTSADVIETAVGESGGDDQGASIAEDDPNIVAEGDQGESQDRNNVSQCLALCPECDEG